MSYYTINNNELYHHGIKGMKWGVRRFQNADGSRTAAGKKRIKSKEKTSNKSTGKSIKKTAIKWGIILGASLATAKAIDAASNYHTDRVWNALHDYGNIKIKDALVDGKRVKAVIDL